MTGEVTRCSSHTEVPVPTFPHDVPDLYLAPVLLAIDARLEELGKLDLRALTFQVALTTNREGSTRRMRETDLLMTIADLIDCHGWNVGWDERGLRLTHGGHGLVLGVPGTFAAFVSGSANTLSVMGLG
jgi:hypothetical protein